MGTYAHYPSNLSSFKHTEPFQKNIITGKQFTMKSTEIYRHYIALITTAAFTFGLMFNQLTGFQPTAQVSKATILSLLVSFICLIKMLGNRYHQKKEQEELSKR